MVSGVERSRVPLVVIGLLAACSPRPSAIQAPLGTPRDPTAERTAHCRSVARRSPFPSPEPPPYWEHYAVPAHWSASERELAFEVVLALVGVRDDRGKRVEAVVVDRSAGTVDALATRRGHEMIVIRLGGCVLYSENIPAGWIIAVVPLDHLQAGTAVQGMHAASPEEIRIVADAATNSVVLLGPEAAVARQRELLLVADCLAGAA